MTSELSPDAPVDLHLLLCKALREGVMTEELTWRAWTFFSELYMHTPRSGYHPVQIVSGGGGEATAVKVWLGFAQSLLCMPRAVGTSGPFGGGVMFLETQSPNSRLNIAFALQKVREKGFFGQVRLTIYSSGYHTDELLALRYKLPQVSPFSFIREPNAILDVYAKPAPYLYPVCGIKELEWLAEIYLVRQRLRFAWENVRGISGVAGEEEAGISLELRTKLGLIVVPGSVGEFLVESVTRIENSLARAQVLLDDPFQPSERFVERIKCGRQHLKDFLREVGSHLAWLRAHQGRVPKNDLTEWSTRAGVLEQFLNPTHVREFDPDTEGILWETYGAPNAASPAATMKVVV